MYTSDEVPFEVLRFINTTLDRKQRGYAWLYLAYLKGDACEPNGRGIPGAAVIRDKLWLLVPDKDGSAIRFNNISQ